MYKSSFDLLVSYYGFQLVFVTNCGLSGYVYIFEIVPDILDKPIHNSRNVCGCFTLNEMHIELASSIFCSINNNLTNISSTFPPEVKNKNSIIYSKYDNFVYLERNFHLLNIQG